jgi:protein TonB
MERKKSFLIILILIVSAHVYLFAQLKVEEPKTIVAPKPTSSAAIKLNNVVIKKQEVKPKPKKVEKVVVEKKPIIKKKLPKTKSKNIVKEVKKKVKKKKIVKKKIEKKVEKPVEKPIKKPEPKKVFEKEQVPQEISQKVQKSKKINPKVLKAVENQYLLKLKRLIDKNKKYPKTAKRLNQTGKVYLSFTIGKNGEIKNVRISKNSKYSRLNKAAMEILTKIKKFEPIPKELNKNSWDITVPVAYQIVRS